MALAELKSLGSDLMNRMRWAQMAGLSFGGRRDIYQILGYRRDLTFYDFYDRYMRDGLAKAVVEAYPTATWRGGVELYEDEKPEVVTKFEQAFKELDERLGFWQKCQQVDIAAGLSTFAVMLIGNGEANVEAEMKQGGEVLFLKPYFGGGGPAGNRLTRIGSFDATASVAQYDVDPSSERFGEPKSYYIRQSNTNLPGFNREVHWSRIIHVAEGTLEDDVFGIPTLQCVFNLFDDLAKLTGGGSEAFWLRANQGLILDVDKDMSLAAGQVPAPGSSALPGLTEPQRTALREKAEELQHQLQRVMVTRGVTATQLGSDVAQFSTSGDFLLKLIAGAARVPLRILTGSDRVGADLDQDAANFDSRVQDRRTGYAGPKIVRRAIDRFIKYDMLPKPKQYTVGWPVEEDMDEAGKAAYAVSLASVNQTQGDVVFTSEEIRDMAFDLEPLTPEQKTALADEAAAKVQAAQDAMGPKKEPAFKAAEDDELLRVLEAAIEADNVEVIAEIIGVRALGDVPGHEFHGNQFTEGGGPDPNAKLTDDNLVSVRSTMRGHVAELADELGLKPKTGYVGSYHGKASFQQKERQLTVSVKAQPGVQPRYTASISDVFQTSLGGNSVGNRFEFRTRKEQAEFARTALTNSDLSGFKNRSLAVNKDLGEIVGLGEHSYATTQLTLPADITESILALGRGIPDADLAADGRETDAHVTVKYGLVNPDLGKLRALLTAYVEARIYFGRTAYFETPDYDVVYVSVTGGNLDLLNKAVSNGMECAPSDHGAYVPHATVAYVKPGLGAKYAGLNALDGMSCTSKTVTLVSADGTRSEVGLA